MDIAVINHSTVLSDDDVRRTMLAIQKQLDGDFAPIWGFSAKQTFYPKGEVIPVGTAQMIIADDSDQIGALGYHELDDSSVPLGFVFARTDQQDGLSPSVTQSHETLEMVGDPFASLSVQNGNRLYCLENCDACEDDSYAYEIDGVKVSDFVTPAWFGMYSTAAGFDKQGKIKAPFELLPGGYIGILDLGQSDNWQQLTAQMAPGMREPRFWKNPYSRRNRRFAKRK